MQPYFYQRLIMREGHPVPNPEKMPEKMLFRVLGYSEVGNYTLVLWQEGTGVGENLYRDRVPVCSVPGSAPLYTSQGGKAEVKSTLRSLQVSITDKLDSRLGKYGVPSTIAHELRQKVVWFVRPDQIEFDDFDPQA